nr:MAG TPA: hypothetical protein [Caudoviricetes sp.]
MLAEERIERFAPHLVGSKLYGRKPPAPYKAVHVGRVRLDYLGHLFDRVKHIMTSLSCMDIL